MSLTMKEWEEEIKKLPRERRDKIKSALETLKEWEVFNAHFSWTLMFLLAQEIDHINRMEDKS